MPAKGHKPVRTRSKMSPQEKKYQAKSADHIAASLETEAKKMLDLAKILRGGNAGK